MMMAMKMAAVASISLLLLCGFAISSTDSQGACDKYAATGDNVTVPLSYKLKDSEILKWYKEKEVVFYRSSSQVISGRKEDVSKNGSLKLMNVKKSAMGTYKPEVFAEGRSTGELKITRLCVLDHVPKPSVTVSCKLPLVTFTCKNAKDYTFEWLQNDKVLEKENKFSLTRNAGQVQSDSWKCKFSNRVSSLTSDAVTQTCVESFFPEKLFGINTWIFVGAGGGVVLVLIITVIVCCVCTKRKKRMKLKDEGELRLAWTNEHHQHHHHQQNHPPDHHPHHHHHQNPPPDHPQQQPAGHTGPRQPRSKQQRPRVPDGHPQPSPRRAAQASRPADDEQPPPLPQPRKKAAKIQRV